MSVLRVKSCAVAGRPGLSAYQIAVLNGYTGSEEQWLASLKGDKGDTGAAGQDGTNGTNGADAVVWSTAEAIHSGVGGAGDFFYKSELNGPSGAAFAAGQMIFSGNSCYVYFVSSVEETLVRVDSYRKGIKGDKGDTGNTGAKGDDGETGALWYTTSDYDESNKIAIADLVGPSDSTPHAGQQVISAYGAAYIYVITSVDTTDVVVDVSNGKPLVQASQIESAVDDWLDANITNPDSPPLDRSLSSSAAAAPADLVGAMRSDLYKTLSIPLWFPSVPYPVYWNGKKWTFDDIDITSYTVKYAWKTYYIDSVNGSDSNNGTSASTPFKTLKQFISKNTGAGYPTKGIIADGSVFYFPDLKGSSFNLSKSLSLEAENRATIICGFPASSFGFSESSGVYTSTVIPSGYTFKAFLDISESLLDDYGLYKPMNKVQTAADVVNPGDYCIASGTITVYPYTSISNVVGLVSTNTGFFPVSSGPWDEITGVSFKNITIIGNWNYSRAAHSKKAVFLAQNCIFQHNPDNNNMTLSGIDISYLKDCTAGYACLDCFNIAAGNMTSEQTAASVCVYANCKAKEAGFYDTNENHTCNLNTAHTATNIIRCGFIGYNADGPMIADVNGCYSIMYDVSVYNNSYAYTTAATKGAFEFNSSQSNRSTKQVCVNCFAFDNRAAYKHLVTSGEIWIAGGNLMCDAQGGIIYPYSS